MSYAGARGCESPARATYSAAPAPVMPLDETKDRDCVGPIIDLVFQSGAEELASAAKTAAAPIQRRSATQSYSVHRSQAVPPPLNYMFRQGKPGPTPQICHPRPGLTTPQELSIPRPATTTPISTVKPPQLSPPPQGGTEFRGGIRVSCEPHHARPILGDLGSIRRFFTVMPGCGGGVRGELLHLRQRSEGGLPLGLAASFGLWFGPCVSWAPFQPPPRPSPAAPSPFPD